MRELLWAIIATPRVFLLSIVLGLGLAWAEDIPEALSGLGYEAATCHIEDARAKVEGGRHNLSVELRWSVAGTEYTGTLHRFGVSVDDPANGVEELLSRYRTGSTMDCYYRPQEPDVVSHWRADWKTAVRMFGGAAIVFGSLALYIWLVARAARKTRRRNDATSVAPDDGDPNKDHGDVLVIEVSARRAFWETAALAGLMFGVSLTCGLQADYHPVVLTVFVVFMTLFVIGTHGRNAGDPIPVRIELGPGGLRMFLRRGRVQTARWDRVKAARRDDEHWYLDVPSGTIEIRDIGVTVEEWDRLGDRIRAAGRAHGFECG